MRRPQFTFEHKKGFFIPNDSLFMIILSGILFLFVFLEQKGYLYFGNWMTLFFAIWLLCFIVFMISRFFLYEIENGEYIGKLILKEESILINDIEYKLEEITSIKIYSSDIKGKRVNNTFEFTRHLSNGLDNEITLKLNNGELVKTHFLQTDENKIKFSEKYLINYHLKKKYSLLHLLEILEITDYDKIQIFKKNLKNY
ncbi:hypothetical protein QVZ41_13930 [Wenyingzhuangia sp. chi5]|uniref:SMODS-associating 2TM beta-strand rich effector domain-containing protein n=1 Tax=Wenyingzhuangia gilva TaxID=3057677 RepID=A0ABT8VVE4_9FLAO|nr:hypothetical protein [Wenyingzhuangia sp. chi5]MDO3695946.1 hypothetical protein [Wenyingzhuangia sp. chi5]